MKLHETTAARLLWYAATQEAEAARQYLGHVLKRGAPLEPVRQALADMISGEFYDAMLTAIPWLADDTFGEPKQPSANTVQTIEERIVAMLTKAGMHGLSRSNIRGRFADRAAFDIVIKDLESRHVIASLELGTKGRPALTYWIEGEEPLLVDGGGAAINIDPFEQAQETLRKAQANMGE